MIGAQLLSSPNFDTDLLQKVNERTLGYKVTAKAASIKSSQQLLSQWGFGSPNPHFYFSFLFVGPQNLITESISGLRATTVQRLDGYWMAIVTANLVEWRTAVIAGTQDDYPSRRLFTDVYQILKPYLDLKTANQADGTVRCLT